MENSKKELDAFENVVVLMLENRSFDNLLGYLYDPKYNDKKDVPAGTSVSFAGLQDTDIHMPVPSDAHNPEKNLWLAPRPVADGDYHQPYPDPGEVYQHVNTQLFNHIDDNNKKVEACKMHSPYNLQNPSPPAVPNMEGFVKDYINTLQAIKCKSCKWCLKCIFFGKCKSCKACESYHKAAYKQYSKIMECYTPSQIPVLTTLAREFAVFDHWYCSVPSQTWCNRAFWHAATSGGKVVNPTDACGIIHKIEAMDEWMDDVWTRDTLFERMKSKDVSHRVYTQEWIALTTLVNGPFKDENTVIMDRDLNRFKDDITNGNLPKYSFVEPRFLGQHNDQHPSSANPSFDDGPTRVGSVLLGEYLIWDVYTTIFNSDYKDNTLLIITYDEHGGCFDHVPPPPPKNPSEKEKVYPPDPNVSVDKNQMGFGFDRLGIRVPMVMVSAFIEKNTIMNERFDHTSFIKTMSDKWHLDGLTDRDAHANTFEKVFSETKRDSFPQIKEPCIPQKDESIYDNDTLNDLQLSIVKGAHHLAKYHQKLKGTNKRVPKPLRIKKVKHAKKYLKGLNDHYLKQNVVGTNAALFNKISSINGHDLNISLDSSFITSLDSFRKLTSELKTFNKIQYPAVYLSNTDYGGLTISHGSHQLRLIVNLQFYYVYGFFLDDNKIHAFSGEGIKALTDFGFDCDTIPYGDGYYDIKKVLGEKAFNNLLNTEVSLTQLISALNQLANINIPFTDKAKSILIVFWSLIEGIRFAGISNVILDLIQNNANKYKTYSTFYDLAEVWSELCVKAVDAKTLNQDIAVYDLDRVE